MTESIGVHWPTKVAAAHLNTNPFFLKTMAILGQIPAMKVGVHWFFDTEAVSEALSLQGVDSIKEEERKGYLAYAAGIKPNPRFNNDGAFLRYCDKALGGHKAMSSSEFTGLLDISSQDLHVLIRAGLLQSVRLEAIWIICKSTTFGEISRWIKEKGAKIITHTKATEILGRTIYKRLLNNKLLIPIEMPFRVFCARKYCDYYDLDAVVELSTQHKRKVYPPRARGNAE